MRNPSVSSGNSQRLWVLLFIGAMGPILGHVRAEEQRPEDQKRRTPQQAQEFTIVVKGGYTPDLVVARKGIPLKLVFDRQESNACSAEVVIPDFQIRRALAASAKTTIEMLPAKTGEFPFSCGMNMLHGKIRVVD